MSDASLIIEDESLRIIYDDAQFIFNPGFSCDYLNFDAVFFLFDIIGFNTSAGDEYLIRLTYADDDFSDNINGSKVLSFEVLSSADTIDFNISGFGENISYDLYIDGWYIERLNSSSDGHLVFDYFDCSYRNFSIYKSWDEFVLPEERISSNLGMSLSDVILLMIFCGLLLLGAFDIRVAAMFGTLLYSICFVVFYQATVMGYSGFEPFKAGVIVVFCIVILALLVLSSGKSGNQSAYGTF